MPLHCRKEGDTMKFIYEPITGPQIIKIHATKKEQGVLMEDLYSMIEDIISIPLMTALSKQEAIYIIERLSGDEQWPRPPRCHTENEVPGGEKQPTMRQITAIRVTLKALGWTRAHIKAWLKKYRHVSSIRELDREKASETYAALKSIQEHSLKKASSAAKENNHVLH